MSGHPCPDRILLPEALTGRLEPTEEKRVMAHLESCAACQDVAADIEISLVSLAVLKDGRDGGLEQARGAHGPSVGISPAPRSGSLDPAAEAVPTRFDSRPARRPQRARVALVAAAAALVLLAGGALVGRQLLPPRDSVSYGPPVALAPPAGAADRAARGSVKVATEGSALAVRLAASSLPAAGWYECVWVAGGQTRSAGSFRATDGAVNVELRVAQPQGEVGWDLQVIAHRGTASEVVLEGRKAGPT